MGENIHYVDDSVLNRKLNVIEKKKEKAEQSLETFFTNDILLPRAKDMEINHLETLFYEFMEKYKGVSNVYGSGKKEALLKFNAYEKDASEGSRYYKEILDYHSSNIETVKAIGKEFYVVSKKHKREIEEYVFNRKPSEEGERLNMLGQSKDRFERDALPKIADFLNEVNTVFLYTRLKENPRDAIESFMDYHVNINYVKPNGHFDKIYKEEGFGLPDRLDPERLKALINARLRELDHDPKKYASMIEKKTGELFLPGKNKEYVESSMNRRFNRSSNTKSEKSKDTHLEDLLDF